MRRSPRWTVAPPTLSEKEIKKLIRTASKLNTVAGLRGQALLEVVYCCCAGGDAVQRIKLTDYTDGFLRIPFPTERTVVLGPESNEIIRRYIKQARHYMIEDVHNYDELFLRPKGGVMDKYAVRDIMRFISKPAGVRSSVRKIKWSYPRHLFEHGSTVTQAAKILGFHRNTRGFQTLRDIAAWVVARQV